MMSGVRGIPREWLLPHRPPRVSGAVARGIIGQAVSFNQAKDRLAALRRQAKRRSDDPKEVRRLVRIWGRRHRLAKAAQRAAASTATATAESVAAAAGSGKGQAAIQSLASQVKKETKEKAEKKEKKAKKKAKKKEKKERKRARKARKKARREAKKEHKRKREEAKAEKRSRICVDGGDVLSSSDDDVAIMTSIDALHIS
eukprot:gnl/TRDRNA2_/TRDRNA2_64298_c0_seq2.p1 gnl/TRDRNA2_/TRDRNA2_64298_c0~~gnl/TRDRNA2_/TRDRNA2_64298_c0_seq2.p1  ORF type:complete len:235 (+),score=64.75 gnl/TRDRNA2_/TRDRNA2_64298_c0_seq2:108-707(+)